MNVLITGGAGFIGSNFVFHMLDTYPEYRIVCLDKLTYAGNLSTLASVMDNPQFRFVKADICDREAVDKVFEEVKPTSSKDMGLIMKNISPLVKGRADMSLVNKLIKEKLG